MCVVYFVLVFYVLYYFLLYFCVYVLKEVRSLQQIPLISDWKRFGQTLTKKALPDMGI